MRPPYESVFTRRVRLIAYLLSLPFFVLIGIAHFYQNVAWLAPIIWGWFIVICSFCVLWIIGIVYDEIAHGIQLFRKWKQNKKEPQA